MASITTADFRNGMGLKIKDKYYTIVEFQHVKPGKGGAFVRYKTKDLKTGPATPAPSSRACSSSPTRCSTSTTTATTTTSWT